MNLRRLIEDLGLSVEAGAEGNLEAEVTRGYASDLLSDVIANAEEGSVWVTLQAHQNIVAVGVMKSLAAILLVHGRTPEPATREKADRERIPILTSPLPAFELIGRLYALGVRGEKE